MDPSTTTNGSDLFSKMSGFDIIGFINNIFTFIFDFFSPTSQYAKFWTTVKMILAFFSIFCIFLIAYCIVRLFEIRKKEHEYVHHQIHEYAKKHAEKEKEGNDGSKNARWRAVLEYIFSDSNSDWKLAIIEADSMLDSLMEDLGFKGDSLGEKLKMADQEKFPSLTLAWQVHNTRNRIAHEAGFELSHHEAKRLVAIYEDIFSQYGFI